MNKDELKALALELLAEMPPNYPRSIFYIYGLLWERGKVDVDCDVDLFSHSELIGIQLQWISECAAADFLKEAEMRLFSDLWGDTLAAAKNRLIEIIDTELEASPETFPVPNQISALLHARYGTSIPTSLIRSTVRYDLAEWVEDAEMRTFLDHFSKGSFKGTEEECREAVRKRMHGTMLSHSHDLAALPVSQATLSKYVKSYPDLEFILASSGTSMLTTDQQIALSMHLWAETRDPTLHELIGKRLEQLWGFRELYALAMCGLCDDAVVVSPFHESISERLAEYRPDARIEHHFVDSLRDGKVDFRDGRDVILLSFMHWFGEAQASGMLRCLNGALFGNNVTMSAPGHVSFSEDVSDVLSLFGFGVERIGTISLIPPDGQEVGQCLRKMLTSSNIIRMKKERSPEQFPGNACLFEKKERRHVKSGGPAAGTPSGELSYDAETLMGATAVISVRGPKSALTEEEVEVEEILAGGDEFLLQLKGGAVVGFNMDPARHFTVEMAGARIPKGTEESVLRIIEGERGFDPPAEMKEAYERFLCVIKKRKAVISDQGKAHPLARGLVRGDGQHK